MKRLFKIQKCFSALMEWLFNFNAYKLAAIISKGWKKCQEG